MAGEDSAHHLRESFACFLEDEGTGGVGPSELETGAERRDPNLADGSVGTDHEASLFGFFEEKLELFALAFDLEIVLVAKGEKAAAKRVEGGVAVFAEELFVH